MIENERIEWLSRPHWVNITWTGGGRFRRRLITSIKHAVYFFGKDEARYYVTEAEKTRKAEQGGR